MLCQIFQPWPFRLVCLRQSIILSPPVMQDSNNFVQLNAFASKGATNAVIVGTSVMIESFLMTALSERNFPIFANWLTLSIFSLATMGEGSSQVDLPRASHQLNPVLRVVLICMTSNIKLFTRAPFKTAQGPANDVKYLYQVCYFRV